MILNPGIEALRRELVLLDKGNLTWRFYSRKCEYIQPFAEYIEQSQWPNLEDFLADPLNAGFKQKIDAHNDVVSLLEAAACGFFDGLTQSELFLKDAENALAEYRSGAGQRPQYPDADALQKDLPKYVAEYLINGVVALPHHYLTHKFWEEFRNAFEHSAVKFERYGQRESFHALRRSSDGLRNTTGDLLNALERHRQELCSTYDIPAAPFGNISQSADPYITRRR
jgi:hypothetical protein